MTHDQYTTDDRVELRELNRLFLTFLRRRTGDHGASLGLPQAAAMAIAAAPDGLLQRMANYPQALFRVDFQALGIREVHDARNPGVDGQLRSLQLMLLVSARHLARQTPYAARLYLRLSAAELRELGNLAITDLPLLSRRPGVIRGAYRRYAWMWSELLQTPQPDRTRAVVLLGLQPTVELNGTALLNR